MSNQQKPFFITSPIYYVNDKPHIGHAYTTIAADVLARHYKNAGREVFFLTGTDEHGAKIVAAAHKAGQSPQEFVDALTPAYQKTWDNLGIEYDGFVRTTNPEHEQIVKELVQKLKADGYLEKKSYEGLYCEGCERFLKEEDLVDGRCPDHHTVPQKQSEENYFFLLSRFAEQLLEKIEKNEIIIEPASRRNEILGKIKQGLEDVSISRAGAGWGIPFPGDEKQTIYVWVDALINYYSATRIFETEKWEQHPADIHLMAKDILWFHAVIWPALLMALDLPLPQRIFAHGFFTIGGKKMSKSLGNVIDPNIMAKKYGADAVRYALLREFPFGEDGDISEAKIAARYEKDLANELGNLLQRVLVMCDKYHIDCRSNSVDASHNPSVIPREVCRFEESLNVNNAIESCRFDIALALIWDIIHKGNEIIDKEKPWELAKKDANECATVLRNLYNMLVAINKQIEPFMPETSEKMRDQLQTLKPSPLFPRL